MSNFTHLHVHSMYSKLDGACKPDLVAKKAKSLGQTHLAVTDHGTVAGVLKMYKACRDEGVQLIPGIEAYHCFSHRTDKSSREQPHLTILAKNITGYKNLIKLSSEAYLSGFYYKPRIDWELLERHREGLICLSGCVSSQLSRSVASDKGGVIETTEDYTKSIDLIQRFQKIFGDDFYLEIMSNGNILQDAVRPHLIELSWSEGVPLVATSDVHYVEDSDTDLQDMLERIGTGKRIHDEKITDLSSGGYHLRSAEEMYAASHEEEWKWACERTMEIADQVDVEIETGKRFFPKFDGGEPTSTLRKLCYEGMHERLGKTSPSYTQRLEHELEIINSTGFADYFCIVHDIARWARDHGIFCTARGSGVGSLVGYCLFISHVDPLQYGLLFERFLSPSRKEAPDLDLDFEKERRAEVMRYITEKYGEECCAKIGTFGTLAARAAIKDVGRVYNVPLDKTENLVKHVPELPGTTIDDAMEVTEFAEQFDQDPVIRDVVAMARRVEGMTRNQGTHAAAIVISDGPLVDYVPLCLSKGEKTTAWDMHDVEDAGLLKLDLLGLRTLDVMTKALDLIEDDTGKRIDLGKV